jgi:hypothetical protein
VSPRPYTLTATGLFCTHFKLSVFFPNLLIIQLDTLLQALSLQIASSSIFLLCHEGWYQPQVSLLPSQLQFLFHGCNICSVLGGTNFHFIFKPVILDIGSFPQILCLGLFALSFSSLLIIYEEKHKLSLKVLSTEVVLVPCGHHCSDCS